MVAQPPTTNILMFTDSHGNLTPSPHVSGPCSASLGPHGARMTKGSSMRPPKKTSDPIVRFFGETTQLWWL